LHLGKFYPPEYGGIESVTEALAEDHAAAGHQVRVLCFSRQNSGIEKRGRLVLERHRQLAELSSQPLSASYVFAGLRAVRRADIVHLHAPNLLAALVSLATPRRARLVIHWHADIIGKGFISKLVRPLEWLMLRRANAVVCTSQDYSDSSPVLQTWRDKIQVIPIGIDDIDQDSQGGVTDGSVLFVGRLVPYKGVPVLLKAAACMGVKAPVNIVGVGPEQAALRRQVKDLGLEDRVRFLGRVNQATLDGLFRRAIVFCLPSVNRLEAFGVVQLEAMRAGCPVVCSAISGSGVVWVNETGMHVPVGDHKALAACLDDILSCPELRDRKAREARERFQTEFRRKLMTDRFLSLYEMLSPSVPPHALRNK